MLQFKFRSSPCETPADVCSYEPEVDLTFAYMDRADVMVGATSSRKPDSDRRACWPRAVPGPPRESETCDHREAFQPVCVEFQFRRQLGYEISLCNVAARNMLKFCHWR